ncbi:MAG: SRPBCC domain-containing protein [Pseudomonadota bacterium]
MSKGQVLEEAAIMFERDLPASPEISWSFLTETARLTEWYGEGVIEQREGGAVTLMGGHIRGVVTGWRPGRFFAHTWNVFDPGENISAWPVSYLEFTLEAQGSGTRLVLIHRPIPKAMQPQTMMGWQTYLDMLETAVRGQPVSPRGAYMQKNAALYGVDLNNLKR